MLLSVAAVLLAAVGQFEGHGDVGAPKLAGSAAYNAATQEYTLTAAGTTCGRSATSSTSRGSG